MLPILIICGVLLYSSETHAASDGRVGECDARSTMFGCTQWANDGYGGENRMECTDERGGIMPWAAAPVQSDFYTIRSGNGLNEADDPEEYVPEEYVTIFVKALDLDWKYRGLLLHAVDESKTTVGKWGLPSDKSDYDYWHPDTCGEQYVLHANGDDKLLTNRFHFKAPKAGTGTITFQLLLKKGPPNLGEFYYPKKDLVLKEAGRIPSRKMKWYIGNKGDDCHSTCETHGLKCNSQMLLKASQIGEEEGLEKLGLSMSREFPCTMPLIKDCSVGTPAAFDPNPRADTSKACYFHDTNCSANAKPTAEDLSIGPPRCGSYHPDARRFCACGNIEEHFSAAYYATSTAAKGPTMNKSFIAFSLFISTLLLLLQGGGTHQPSKIKRKDVEKERKDRKKFNFGHTLVTRMSIRNYMMTCLIAFFALFPVCTNAHNWLGSWSRAGKSQVASMICVPYRKGYQAQVGKGQKFYVMPSTGHGGDVFLVGVKKEDEEWLNHHNIIGMARDYINLAPEGTNTALETGNRRMHITAKKVNRLSHEMGRGILRGKKLFKRKVPSTDPLYKIYPGQGKKQSEQATDEVMHEYNDEFVAHDKQISYRSEKYPWIEFVQRYNIWIHFPHDYFSLPVSIPGRHGLGHYVVKYMWRGYSDCIDVDLQTNPTEFPHGEITTGPLQFERIDHCVFEDPKAVVTPCLDASTNASACIKIVNDKYGPGSGRDGKFGPADSQYGAPTWGTLMSQLNMGINVAPVRKPEGTIATTKTTIPWQNQRCSLESDVRPALTGTITRSDTEIMKSFSITQQAGKNCKWRHSMGPDMNLNEALRTAAGKPSGHTCTAISYMGKDISKSELQTTKRHWWCCKDGSPIIWNGWWNKAHSLVSWTFPEPKYGVKNSDPQVAGTRYKFAFEPNGTVPEAGFYQDHGWLYQKHSNGLTYGWNCKQEEYNFGRSSNDGAKRWFLRGLEWPCAQDSNDPGKYKKWEFLLPEGNGLYEVIFFASSSSISSRVYREWDLSDKWAPKNRFFARDNVMRGCVLENDRVWHPDFWGRQYIGPSHGHGPCRGCPSLVKNIVISDGKFTLSVKDRECSMVNKIELRKIANTETPSFYPSSANPWQQLEIEGGSTAIENVVVKAPGYGSFAKHSCADRLLFEGDWCRSRLPEAVLNEFRDTREVGSFPHGGFVVSIADSPCNAQTGICPAAKHVCKHVIETETCADRGVNNCPISVNCGGVVGKFVRVQLPGQKRILHAEISVYPTPDRIPSSKTMACWGVLARDPTIISPVYTIIKDPEDPRFYSTCFLRKKAFAFLAPEATSPKKLGKFQYGEKCLDCSNLAHNMDLVSTTDDPKVPKWIMADKCIDCVNANLNLQFNHPEIVRPDPPPPPPPGLDPPGSDVGSTGTNGGVSTDYPNKPKTKSEEEKQKEGEVARHQTTIILNAIFIPLAIIAVLWVIAYKYHFEGKWKDVRRLQRWAKKAKEKLRKVSHAAEVELEKDIKLVYTKVTNIADGNNHSDSESSSSSSSSSSSDSEDSKDDSRFLKKQKRTPIARKKKKKSKSLLSR